MPHVHKLFNLTIINAVQSKRISRNLAFLPSNKLLVSLTFIRIESKLFLISVYSSIMVPEHVHQIYSHNEIMILSIPFSENSFYARCIKCPFFMQMYFAQILGILLILHSFAY